MDLAFLLQLLLSFATAALCSTETCRCRPSEPCWPSPERWQQLNSSIDGHLVAVKPYAHVCHEPDYDAAACDAITANAMQKSAFLTTQPGAMQYPNWGALPSKNETCYIGTDKSIPCGQGRVPLFSAQVRQARHVQEAVRFAKHHNLKLVIKNTGHTYLGTSSGPDSLQIFTHYMNSISFAQRFVPHGSRDSVGSTVTIGAGVILQDLYRELAKHKVVAVAGLSPSVGAAGGYIQGAGHSPISSLLGLAADNAVQFTVVTANGDLVTANAHQHSDLFWALRGGGGGTFGVVVDVTVRTFPDIPVYIQPFAIKAPNADEFWSTVTEFHRAVPGLSDAGVSSYYVLTIPGTPIVPSNATFTLSGILIFANFTQSESKRVESITQPLVTRLRAIVGDGVGFPPANFTSSAVAFVQYQQATSPDPTGFIDRVGSRLISKDLMLSADGPAALSAALKTASPYALSILGHVVAGGQVARNAKLVDNAVNPAWRRAITHIVLSWLWKVNATLEEQKFITSGITNEWMPPLRELEPDMGAYVNEADVDEPNWQKTFWGANYKRLKTIKDKWDPEGLFITRRGVGSEKWDDEGICKS